MSNQVSLDQSIEDAKAKAQTPIETEARVKLGPRDFHYQRKITLSNYNPQKKFETEDFGVTHDSFEEARAVVEPAVNKRIKELHGIEEVQTKE
jgi:hypothetical protein